MVNYVLIIICTLLFNARPTEEKDLYIGNGKVDFISSAPLEIITAKSSDLKGIINLTDNSFAFSIRVTSFDGFNSLLQKEHFNENYMESSKYPKATFAGNIVNLTNCENNCNEEILAKGKLSLHGVTKVITIPVRFIKSNNDIQAISKFDLLLSDFDIEIPLILEGKISPVIQVSVNIDFSKKSGQ